MAAYTTAATVLRRMARWEEVVQLLEEMPKEMGRWVDESLGSLSGYTCISVFLDLFQTWKGTTVSVSVSFQKELQWCVGCPHTSETRQCGSRTVWFWPLTKDALQPDVFNFNVTHLAFENHGDTNRENMTHMTKKINQCSACR